MKYIKFIIIAVLLNSAFSGCSYVSDYVEGVITDRASFSVKAVYNAGTVTVTWDKTDSSSDFAGFEIYRTSQENDEYADYTRIASRYTDSSLANGSITTYVDTALPSSGIYFYRVGVIHWDESTDDRTADNGYYPSYPNTGWDNESPNYNAHTDVDKVSGYGIVTIP